MPSLRSHRNASLLATAAVAATAVPGAAAQPVYVRPGAPGEPTQQISAEELLDSPSFTYTEADVTFLQDMIPHHGQALTMSDWAPGRGSAPRILALAERIGITQAAEIARMREWLERRGEEVPQARGGMHDMDMPGMLTMEQLAELESLSGAAFDIRFLELMIPHHQGAITMVNRLQATPGGGLEPMVNVLAENIEVDQRAEIGRMQRLLEELGA